MPKKSVGEQPDKTTARIPNVLVPLSAAPVDVEFVDFKGLERGWGIKRSLAYQLLADGAIKGVSLRRRGLSRGKRLFSVDSVREFLRGQMDAAR
jgi:hypothetical protein